MDFKLWIERTDQNQQMLVKMFDKLVSALDKIYSYVINEVAWFYNKTDEFVENPSENFKSWVNQYFPEFPNQEYTKTGGRWGVVYIYNDFVIKFSDDKFEAYVAYLLKDKPITAILDVRKHKNFFVLLQKKANTENVEKMKTAAEILGDWISSPDSPPIHKPKEELLKDIYSKFSTKNIWVPILLDMLKTILIETNYAWYDISRDNIGEIEGKPVAFDLGKSFPYRKGYQEPEIEDL